MNSLEDFKQAFEKGLSPADIRFHSIVKIQHEVFDKAVKLLEGNEHLAEDDVVSLLLSLIHNLLIKRLSGLPANKQTKAMISFQFMLPQLMASVTKELHKKRKKT